MISTSSPPPCVNGRTGWSQSSCCLGYAAAHADCDVGGSWRPDRSRRRGDRSGRGNRVPRPWPRRPIGAGQHFDVSGTFDRRQRLDPTRARRQHLVRRELGGGRRDGPAVHQSAADRPVPAARRRCRASPPSVSLTVRRQPRWMSPCRPGPRWWPGAPGFSAKPAATAAVQEIDQVFSRVLVGNGGVELDPRQLLLTSVDDAITLVSNPPPVGAWRGTTAFQDVVPHVGGRQRPGLGSRRHQHPHLSDLEHSSDRRRYQRDLVGGDADSSPGLVGARVSPPPRVSVRSHSRSAACSCPC